MKFRIWKKMLILSRCFYNWILNISKEISDFISEHVLACWSTNELCDYSGSISYCYCQSYLIKRLTDLCNIGFRECPRYVMCSILCLPCQQDVWGKSPFFHLSIILEHTPLSSTSMIYFNEIHSHHNLNFSQQKGFTFTKLLNLFTSVP